MAEVKILVEGYAREEEDVLFASPNTVLVRDSGKNILVDPGANKELLLKALEKENLETDDIDIIFITHYHLDHLLNIRLFPNHDIYDGDTIFSGDKEINFSEKIPETNVKIIETPGHAPEHTALLVETDEGNVVIAGDVFWWMNKWEQKTDKESLLSLKDPFVKNEDELRESRQKLLELADWIIPGHGKMFKVEK